MADQPKSTKSNKTVITTVAHEPAAPQHLPPAPHLVEEEGGVGRYLWNSDKHELLGRTLASWFFITVFYLIFFFCLFCFFVVSWYISLSVLDVNAPYRQGKGAILGHSGPGLSGRPIPDRENNGVSTLLWFKISTYADYHFWSDQLVSWFKHIPKEKDDNVQKCLEQGTHGSKTFLKETDNKTDKSCSINPGWYGPCKGEDKTFGYDRAEPCILFKMNRIYGWIPEPFTMEEWKKMDADGKVPKALAKYITSLGSAGGGGSGGGGSGGGGSGGDGSGGDGSGGDGSGGSGAAGAGAADKTDKKDQSRKKRQAAPEDTAAPEGGNGTVGGGAGRNAEGAVTIEASEIPALIEKYIMVWCDGENDHDKEALGSLEYFPGPFIPAAFFPFKSQNNYQTPFLMVQLKRPVPGAMISIVCQAYAKNIKLDKETGIGYSRFQVLAG